MSDSGIPSKALDRSVLSRFVGVFSLIISVAVLRRTVESTLAGAASVTTTLIGMGALIVAVVSVYGIVNLTVFVSQNDTV